MTRARSQKRSAPVLNVVLACATAWAGLAWAHNAWASDGSLDISQYAHTAWKVRDGFTKGEITSIAQTPDGYLWLGTEFGLYRFDGVRAVPWEPPAGEQLPSKSVSNLLVARDGTLWIGTLNGLASWKDGKLAQYPEVSGQVTSLLQGREGTVWFSVVAPGKLCAMQGGKPQCYGAGSVGLWAGGLYEDHSGNLWLAAEAGIWRWHPGSPERYAYPRGVTEGIGSLTEDDSGTLLLPTNDGLKQLVHGQIQNYALPGVTGQFRPRGFFRSSDGSLWIGTQQGLLHFHEGRTDRYGVGEGLSGDVISRMFEDREGDVWVITTNGLDRFREYAFPTISRNQGLSISLTLAVQPSSDGSIWIGGAKGLNRWENGHVTIYPWQSTMSQRGGKDHQELSGSVDVKEVRNSGLMGDVYSLARDDQGRLWVSTGNGLYFEKDRFVRAPGVPGARTWVMAGDGHGRMWISNGTEGLFHFASGDAVQAIPWSRFGQKRYGARALLPDRSQGGVWLGFYDGGIAYFKDGEILASYTVADGLGNGRVNDLRFGSRGALWIGTEGGLSRIKDGRVATLTTRNGLPCDEVHWSIEDDDHFVWVYMPCGLARVARSELDAWVSDPGRKLKLTVYDSADGVRSIGVYGSDGPHVTKSSDGKIWFVTHDGVSVIDPRHLPFNKLPPPVHIEQITADGKTYDAASYQKGYEKRGLPLPAHVRDLTIDYTALSLAVPEKVHFRFKLEGQDSDWREVVNKRQVEYSNLAPKKYRFRVTACNNSGVWNEEGAFLDFSIAPAFYQTYWFLALCVAAILALVWGLHVFRLQQLQQRFNAGLEARVNERTRIARELHDTLLQSFQGLLMRFQAVSNELGEGEPKQELDETIDRAARAITEGRDAVQGLRSSAVERNDLAAALGALGKELAAVDSRRPEFTIQVEGTQRHLHPIVRDEVYSVAGEALRNAFRHADAQHIELEIRYDERQFRLRVRDDGKGIDSQLLMDHGRPGHFGLRGMNERAKQAGGKLSVWSSDPRTGGALESGTEVELRIPAAHAYGSYHAPRHRWWLAEKFSGRDYEMKS